MTDDTLPPERRMRRRVRTIAVLPTLITSANLLAGVLAISYLADAATFAGRALEAAAAGLSEVEKAHVIARDGLLVKAAWLIFFGMFCDALDGRVARMTNTTSSFGAQLDSLADVVTFGVAPALIARVSLGFNFPNVPGRVLVAVGVVYLVGAALRLARYNVESARTDEADSGHITRVFRGLPSPAAAGVVAAIILLLYAPEPQQIGLDLRWLEWVLLFLTPVLGLLMISRLPYAHLMNRYVDGRRPIGGVVVLIVIVFAMISYFQATVVTAFFLYALWGPLTAASHKLLGWPKDVWHEHADEETAAGDSYPLRPIGEPDESRRGAGTEGR